MFYKIAKWVPFQKTNAEHKETGPRIKKPLPKQGDVIRSPKFAHGRYENEKKQVILVDGETVHDVREVTLCEEERVRIAADTGEVPPKCRSIDLGAYDETRGAALFSVEEAENVAAHGERLVWQVTARRIREDGALEPASEQIQFLMSDYRSGAINNVAILRKKDIPHRAWRNTAITGMRRHYLRNFVEDKQDGSSFDCAVLDALDELAKKFC